LDVAEQIGLEFWREYRAWVRSINPDAYLVGEIWWEKWPDKMMNPAPYTQGDIFDAVMFYQVYCPARYFFAKTIGEIDAAQFRDSLLFQWNRLKHENLYAMMNVSSTHDTPRLLTDFFNTNRYKFHATINDDPFYKTGKPDKLTYRRLKLYLVHLFTTIGAPQIWNGEEMGMWGADDPYCRKPLWWKEFNFHPENRNNILPLKAVYDPVKFDNDQFEFYKKLIAIRNANPVLADGELEFVLTKNKTLAYKRFDKKTEILVFFNLEDFKQNFSLNGQYIDLITGKKVVNNLTLNSLSASILKKIN
jgi:glycosidase